MSTLLWLVATIVLAAGNWAWYRAAMRWKHAAKNWEIASNTWQFIAEVHGAGERVLEDEE
jgi:hypothetical protein